MPTQEQDLIIASLAQNSPALRDAAQFLNDNSKASEKAVIILDEQENITLHPALTSSGPALVFTVKINGATHCCLADISQASLQEEENSLSLDPTIIRNLLAETSDTNADNIEITDLAICPAQVKADHSFDYHLTLSPTNQLEIEKQTITSKTRLAKLAENNSEIVTWIQTNKAPIIASSGAQTDNPILLAQNFFAKAGAIYNTDISTLSSRQYLKQLQEQLSNNQAEKEFSHNISQYQQTVNLAEKEIESLKEKNKEIGKKVKEAENNASLSQGKKVSVIIGTGIIAASAALSPVTFIAISAIAYGLKRKFTSDAKLSSDHAGYLKESQDENARQQEALQTKQDVSAYRQNLEEQQAGLYGFTQKNITERLNTAHESDYGTSFKNSARKEKANYHDALPVEESIDQDSKPQIKTSSNLPKEAKEAALAALSEQVTKGRESQEKPIEFDSKALGKQIDKMQNKPSKTAIALEQDNKSPEITK